MGALAKTWYWWNLDDNYMQLKHAGLRANGCEITENHSDKRVEKVPFWSRWCVLWHLRNPTQPRKAVEVFGCLSTTPLLFCVRVVCVRVRVRLRVRVLVRLYV